VAKVVFNKHGKVRPLVAVPLGVIWALVKGPPDGGWGSDLRALVRWIRKNLLRKAE
jgi:hypothetical protein